MTPNPPSTAMAFDFGERRIGVAVGQTVSRTAQALGVVPARGGNPQWPLITAYIDEWQPELLVIGRPQHRDGTDHPLDEKISRFGRRLQGRYNLPVAFIDETLSSYAAQSETGRSDELDALAAQFILESWFNQPAPLTTKST